MHDLYNDPIWEFLDSRHIETGYYAYGERDIQPSERRETQRGHIKRPVRADGVTALDVSDIICQ